MSNQYLDFLDGVLTTAGNVKIAQAEADVAEHQATGGAEKVVEKSATGQQSGVQPGPGLPINKTALIVTGGILAALALVAVLR